MKRICCFLFYALFAASLLISCEEEQIIPDNVAPPDQTIENVTISNYVNRVYVSVLGREANGNELSAGYNLLGQNNLSNSSRMQFLGSVLSDASYLPHVYTLARIDLLGNLDTLDIYRQWEIDSAIITTQSNPDIIAYFVADMEKLDSLRQVSLDLDQHAIDITYMHRRCVNNYFYDQINMGTENFVVSCFEHFLNRYPTENELSSSKSMVEGVSAILFLQSGQSKGDFLSIFFSSTDYYEGLATNLYKRYLLRNPTSIEMGSAAQAFKSTRNYEQMQKDILSTNEYIGI